MLFMHTSNVNLCQLQYPNFSRKKILERIIEL